MAKISMDNHNSLPNFELKNVNTFRVKFAKSVKLSKRWNCSSIQGISPDQVSKWLAEGMSEKPCLVKRNMVVLGKHDDMNISKDIHLINWFQE